MSKRTRRNHSAEQKAALLKRHLVDKVAISEICNEAGIQPSLFYYWQRQLFENAGTTLGAGAKGASSRERELEAKVAQLEVKLTKKDSVIAHISEEHVKLKKELGEP